LSGHRSVNRAKGVEFVGLWNVLTYLSHLQQYFDGANKRHLYDANDSKVSGCCLVESKG
jgi:hypothetical protein